MEVMCALETIKLFLLFVGRQEAICLYNVLITNIINFIHAI